MNPPNSRNSRPKPQEIIPQHGPVDRTLAFLFEVAATEGEITISAVAARTGIPTSTAHRLLQRFLSHGLVQRTRGARSYQLGPGMHRLGELITRQNVLVQIALPAMHRLVKHFTEGCTLGVYRPGDRSVEFVAYEESPHPLRYHVELRQPVSVLWGSAGRSVLAFLSAEVIDEVVRSNRNSPTGIPAMSAFELNRELGLIRQKGYAVSRRGERVDGAAAVSAPIFASASRVVGCLTLTVPVTRFDERKVAVIGKALLKETRGISANFTVR
jgi:DNA-binding IclR family transcriptional regulator